MDLRRSDKIVGVVLAGGGSRRMGTDKAFLPRLNGAGTWIGAAVDTLSACFAEVWIVGRNCDDLSDVRDLDLKSLRVLPDLREGVGPLAGVETALQNAGSRSVLTLPCDLPYLQSETLHPVTFLCGSESPPIQFVTTEALMKTLPDARRLELAGQGHDGMYGDPQQFVDEVTRLLVG